MKKRLLYGLLLAALGLNLLVGTQIYLQAAEQSSDNDPYHHMGLFTRVLELVRDQYVDGERISYEDLIHGALRGMISTLDPHSEFMEPKRFTALKDDTEGEFGGLGIVVGMKDGFLTVIAPMDDTPGARAGIQSGDRILRIDGQTTERFSLNECVKRLRGKPGSKVTLSILREGFQEPKDFTVTRGEIKVTTVKDMNGEQKYPLMEEKIGYVRLTQFGEKTASDLEKALRNMEKGGMKALILDLRGNPGGLLDQAVKVAEKFLPANQLVVTTEARRFQDGASYYASGNKSRLDLPMVVLVNLGSASASEIVAGCLKDVKRAVILGEQTFGKGSVQSILPLQDGAALRLTTAKYYTPSHKVIHERGITPDIVVPMTRETWSNLRLKQSPGGVEAMGEEERRIIEATVDNQLARAVDLLKGILLFSNMGSEPAPGLVATRDVPVSAE